MNRKIVQGFAALWVGIALAAGCSMAENIDTQTEALQPTYFEQGEDVGQLYYEYDPMGMHTLPKTMVIDSDGNFYFLEETLGRVQEFDPDGNFISVLEPPEDLASSEDSYPTGLALDSDSNAVLLWATPQGDEDALSLELAIYDASGEASGSYPLTDQPEPISEVEQFMIDQQGMVWVVSERTAYIFTKEGDFNAKITGDICGLDPMGHAIVHADGLRVINRHGTEIGKINMVAGEPPTRFLTIDARGLAIGKVGKSKETQSDTTLQYSNDLQVYRLDRETWLLTQVGELSLPPTKYHYPGEESDLALADQVYMLGTATIVGDTLCVLAYSEQDFWVERSDLSAYLQ